MRDRIRKARLRVHLSLYDNETSAVCQWRLPEAHYLETWGDARAFDGTVTIQQPLIQPLYGGRSALRTAADVHRPAGNERPRYRQGYWASQHTGRGFRSLVAARGARWRGGRHGAAGQDAGAARRRTSARRVEGAAAGRQAGSDLPARPHDLRRPLRQQRLAPGTAQADHQADLGQRRHPQPGHRASPGSEHGRHGAADLPGPLAARAGVGSAGPRGWRGHAAPGLRPHAGRPRGHGHGLQSLRAAHRAAPCGTTRAWRPRSWRARTSSPPPESGHSGGAGLDTRRHIIHSGDIEDYRKDPESVHAGRRSAAARADAVSGLEVRRLRLGHGHRPERLHRLQRLRGGLPGGEQHRRGRQRPGAPRPRHALAARRHLLSRATSTTPRSYNQPVPCMQCENAPCELVCPVQATVTAPKA